MKDDNAHAKANAAQVANAREAYEALPVTVSPEEFAQGHGNWGLTEVEFAEAKRLTRIIVPGSFVEGGR